MGTRQRKKAEGALVLRTKLSREKEEERATLTDGLRHIQVVRRCVDDIYLAWWQVRATGTEALEEFGESKMCLVYAEAMQAIYCAERSVRGTCEEECHTSEHLAHMRPFLDEMYRELRRACRSADADRGVAFGSQNDESSNVIRFTYVELAHSARLVEIDIQRSLLSPV
jgi:hypothetical protein